MSKFTYNGYRKALKGPKLIESVLEQAAQDPDIEFPPLKALAVLAYPDAP